MLPVIAFNGRRFFVNRDLLRLQNVSNPEDFVQFESEAEFDSFIDTHDYEVEGLREVA